MAALLLAVIYLAFISLGLPDSLLGSAWPTAHTDLGVSLDYMGIISMIISLGTIVSSLMSDFLTKKFTAELVTAVSVLLTALALFGFGITNSFIGLCLFAIPYGLGAGAVDAALNNYVALHYKARHMSWLHCFWGIGASLSPYIMGFVLTHGYSWHKGYIAVSVIQAVITVILFISLPLWKINKNTAQSEKNEKSGNNSKGTLQSLKIKGVKYMLVTFFCYSAVEATCGMWASSYLVGYRSVPKNTAAIFASLFCIGITAGRFICGFISEKLGDRKLIRIGIMVITFGIILIMLPFKSGIFSLSGLVITGFGCGPVYPSIIHSTPFNFGKENSQSVIGLQMAGAYVGTTFMSPLFGVIAKAVSLSLYPYYLIIFTFLMLIMSEKLNKIVESRKQQ